jgi:predicted transcriptional regulator
MSETTLISIRVPVKTAERFKALAEVLKRSKSFLGAEAIEEYLSLNEWQIAAIKQGIKSANAGKLVSHKDVTTWVESWGTSNEKRVPQCD